MALSIAGLKASAILTAPWTLSCYVSCCSGMLPKQKEGEAPAGGLFQGRQHVQRGCHSGPHVHARE